MREKPTLVITPCSIWNDCDLPIISKNALDMSEYDEVKVNGDFDKLADDPYKDLNMVITTDISQLNVENLDYYSDVIIRKDDEFFSLKDFVNTSPIYRNIISQFEKFNNRVLYDIKPIVNMCVLGMIKGSNAEYTRCDQYLESIGMMNVICDIFPNIKQELKPLYDLSKAHSLLVENVYTSIVHIGRNGMVVDIVEHEEIDYHIEDSTPKLNLRLTLKVNHNSDHIKYVSITELIQEIFENMSVLYTE